MENGYAASDERLARIASHLSSSRVLFAEPMSNHTSFRIGGPCDLLVLPNTSGDLIKAWTLCKEEGVPCYVVGNGTNLLVRDGGVRGCVIKLAPGFSDIRKTDRGTLITTTGTLLPRLVQEAVRESLSGLEFAVGIPGSVGGALVMNAGAYEGDFGSLVVGAKVYNSAGEEQWLSAHELDFAYRHSIFSDRDDLIALEVELKLTPGDKKSIYDLMLSRARQREQKQPLDVPSAGSAFRRPSKGYVGAMLEELGLKGMKLGGAQISPKHAGFIVNSGNATARDVIELMGKIQDKVKAAYGLSLEPEIVILGEDSVEV
jgi:UDP-N-acetylmuramate dehydrogenase